MSGSLPALRLIDEEVKFFEIGICDEFDVSDDVEGYHALRRKR